MKAANRPRVPDERLAVPVLGLTSPALVCLLAGLLAALLASLMLTWPRLAGPGLRQVALRIIALCAVQASMISLIFVVVNNANGFYSSWADLLGRYTGGGALITLRGGAPVSTALMSVLTTTRVTASGGRPGGTLEAVRIRGQLSGLAVDGYVYLPPGYPRAHQPGLRYPVIVVISAAADSATSPYSARRTATAVAGQIVSGRLTPVILVSLPPGSGQDRGCLNVPGGPQDAMFFARDLPVAIGSRYRAIAPPGRWALLGDSSGGYCALQLAMTSAATFAAAAMPAGRYQSPPRFAAAGSSPPFRRQDDLLWLLGHQPMQPVSVLFTGPPGRARQFLSLIGAPMRAATARLAAGSAPLFPVLDWLEAALGPGSRG